VHMDGEKMSKSLGNMVFAGDLIAQYGSDAVRLYVSGCHYRSELHWNPGVLERAAGLAAELANASAAAGGEAPSVLDLEEIRRHFEERLNDDLDTPGAIHVLLELAAAIKGEAGDAVDVRDAQALLRELGGVLGLSLHSFDR
ncbi:MAG TPA: DALR domain-containing protein, partial [Chloroflexota bacterium]